MHECECGNEREPSAEMCATCWEQDFEHPAVRRLRNAGPATIYEIARELGMKPNSIQALFGRRRRKGQIRQVQVGRPNVWGIA